MGELAENLLDAIYDPALRRGEWRPALTELRELLGSSEIAFTVVEARSSRAELWETTGNVLSPVHCDSYRRNYMHLDPKMAILSGGGPGFLFNDIDHFDEHFVAHDSFYQEYSRPLGIRHTIDLFAGNDGVRETYLAAMRSPGQGPYTDASAAQLRLAARHFVRAFAIGHDLKQAETAASHAGAALDALGFGIAVLGATGRLLFANAFARTTFDARTPLRLVGSQVRANAADDLIERKTRDALTGQPTSFRLRNGKDWLVSVVPLAASSPLAATAGSAVMLVLRPATQTNAPTADAIRAIYGLSHAETAVALGISAGKSLKALAGERRVKLSTVRWQLLAVLRKLGVRRQADVVRVLAALSASGISARGV